MIRLIYRHALTDMDQWELWKFPTAFGEMSVLIRMGLQPDTSDGMYVDVGRFIHDE